MIPHFGPVELILILVIVTMLFGVGKLPEVFGSVGRGIREFRRNSSDPDDKKKSTAVQDSTMNGAGVDTTSEPRQSS
jgi:sec-independent protein translocase protein TatA